MKSKEEIRQEITALRETAEKYDTENESPEAVIAAGAHDALYWAMGWTQESISERQSQ